MVVRRVKIPELEDAPNVKKKFWTDEQKIILVTYYGIKDVEYIANYVKRPLNACRKMADNYNVSSKTTPEERDEIIRRIQEGT